MIFDNRQISDIKDQDLINLIGNQEENLWIDFKERHYEGYRTDGEKYKRERYAKMLPRWLMLREDISLLVLMKKKTKLHKDLSTSLTQKEKLRVSITLATSI